MTDTLNLNNLVLSVTSQPAAKDFEYFEKNLRLDKFVIQELRRKSLHPEFTQIGELNFLSIQLPDLSASHAFAPRGLYLIIEKSRLSIVQYNEVPALNSLVADLQKNEQLMQDFFAYDSVYLAQKILLHLVSRIIDQLDSIIKKVNSLEERLFKSDQDQLVQDINTQRQRVSEMLRIIRPAFEVIVEFRRTMSENPSFLELPMHLRKLEGSFTRLINILDSQRESLQLIYETNESLLTNRTNNIVRILTIFSVIIFPLTLFAAVWGMNVQVPLEGHPVGFWIILTIMFGGVIIMLLIFKLKRWI